MQIFNPRQLLSLLPLLRAGLGGCPVWVRTLDGVGRGSIPTSQVYQWQAQFRAECLPRLFCAHSDGKFGDLGMGISQSLPYTPLLISSQHHICPQKKELSNLEDKVGIASHLPGAVHFMKFLYTWSHQNSSPIQMLAFLSPFHRWQN